MTYDHDQAELDAFRSEAQSLGFTSGDSARPHPELETADDFIGRMRAEERRPQRRVRRTTLFLTSVAAAIVGLTFIFNSHNTPAVAAGPPILDFEFAAATRIAYAPGVDARETLQQLSNAASKAPGPAGEGPIQYRRSNNWFSEVDGSESSKIIPRVSETWLAPNGSLETRESLGSPLRSDGRGVNTEAAGRDPKVVTQSLPSGTVDASFAASLPTDPDQLASALLTHADCVDRSFGDVRSMCLYREIVALFQTYVVPPELSAAIWSMLKSESGFSLLGSVEDRAGRPGVGISITPKASSQYRFVLLVDLSKGDLLGTEELLVRTDPDLDVRPPAVISFSTFTHSSLIEKTPE